MNYGVVGTGYWGSNHARVATELCDAGLVDAVTLCDVDEDRVAELAGTYGHEHVTDASDLAERVDAAVVATPSPTHGEVATDLLAAGTDLLVEKPLALSSDEAWSIVETAEAHDRTLATGHIFRYHPALNELKRRLDRGELGRIKYLNTSRFSFRAPRSTAGTLYSLAVHDVDVYTYLLDEWPDRIHCTLDEAADEDVDETAHLTLTYEDATGVIDASWQVPAFGKRRDLVAVGTEGTAYVDYLDDTTVEFYDSTLVRTGDEVRAREEGSRTYQLPEAEPLRLEVESFVEACRTGDTPRATGRVGAAAVDLLEAAERSARTGQTVDPSRDLGDVPGRANGESTVSDAPRTP